MYSIDSLCRQVAAILGGDASCAADSFTVTKRRNLPLTILGRPSAASVHLEFAFESFDRFGSALCLAELALLQEEIQPVGSLLTSRNILISALHNHWIYTQPTILYLHGQSIDHPLQFASKMSEISKMLK